MDLVHGWFWLSGTDDCPYGEIDPTKSGRPYVLDVPRFTDLVFGEEYVRLCSPKLKAVFDAVTTPRDRLTFTDVLVRGGRRELVYHCAHLPVRDDVLDPELTDHMDRVPMYPVIDARRVRGLEIIAIDDVRWAVSARVRSAIVASRCTGVDLEPVRVSRVQDIERLH